MTEQLITLTQHEISNIARKAFLRGKLEAISTLIEHFYAFKPKVVSKKDLLAALECAKLQLQEAL